MALARLGFVLEPPPGFEIGGYVSVVSSLYSSASTAHVSDGFGILSDVQAINHYGGNLVLNIIPEIKSWVLTGLVANNAGANQHASSGYKTLAGTLDRLRITTANGTDTFDGGYVNISWE